MAIDRSPSAPEAEPAEAASTGGSSGVECSRRTFLGSIAAGIGTAAMPVGWAADVKKPRGAMTVEQQKESAAALLEALKSEEFLTTEYTPESEGKDAVCRGILKPGLGPKPLPVAIVNTVTGERGAKLSVVHPLPCDFGDQGHIASTVDVVTQNSQLQRGKDFTVEIIGSEPSEERPHPNRYLLIRIPSMPDQQIQVQLTSWMMLPTPSFSPAAFEQAVARALTNEEEIQKFRQANGIPPFRLHYEIGNALRAHLQTADQCRTPAERLFYAFKIAGEQVKYEGNVHSEDPNTAFENMLGDCAVKSHLFRALAGGHANIVHGFGFDNRDPRILAKEGKDPSAQPHSRPYIITAEGLCVCEPSGGNHPKLSPPGLEFVAVKYEGSGGFGAVLDEAFGTGGTISGSVNSSAPVTQTGCSLSIPGRGTAGKELAAMARNVPKVVQAYHDFRRAQRLTVYPGK